MGEQDIDEITRRFIDVEKKNFSLLIKRNEGHETTIFARDGVVFQGVRNSNLLNKNGRKAKIIE
jgi:hypothetical protein